MARRGLAIDRGRYAGTAAWACCALFGALALWLLVRLVWQLLPQGEAGLSGERAQPAGAVPVAVAARSVASWHLFGQTPRRAGAAGEAASTLSLILRGTVAQSDPQSGLAVVAGADGSERAFRVGEEVVPGVRLAAVHPDRIVLSRGGAEETLRLPRERNLAPADIVRPAPATASSRTPRPAGSAARTAPAAAPGVQAVKVTDDAQQALARLRQNPDELMKRVPVVPVLDGGRLTGVRVAPGADTALLGQFGLRSGDVVTAVDGQAVDSFARGQQILSSLATAKSARVTVLRDGKPVELDVGLQ
ncbi:type II secretion system protein N [Dokdonella ginsengisoli]|uniref:type II secretion system protein N n=1 Tax=Dokdonella ginsengisoli TaxID=363846 RepID=UPI0036D393FB